MFCKFRAGPRGVALRQRRRRPAERARRRFAATLSATAFFTVRRALPEVVVAVRRLAAVRPLLPAAVLLRLAPRDAALVRFARLGFVVTAPLALPRDLPAARGVAFA